MFIEERVSDCRRLEPIEDQVSTGIRGIVQASKSDRVARGIAIDLLQI